MTESDVVLGSQIAALIVVLHRQGLVDANELKAQMAAAVELQPEYREALIDAILKLQMLIDALGPFAPRCPKTTTHDPVG